MPPVWTQFWQQGALWHSHVQWAKKHRVERWSRPETVSESTWKKSTENGRLDLPPLWCDWKHLAEINKSLRLLSEVLLSQCVSIRSSITGRGNETKLFRSAGINDCKDGGWSGICLFGVPKSCSPQGEPEEAHCQHAHRWKPSRVHTLWKIIQKSQFPAEPYQYPSQRISARSLFTTLIQLSAKSLQVLFFNKLHPHTIVFSSFIAIGKMPIESGSSVDFIRLKSFLP